MGRRSSRGILSPSHLSARGATPRASVLSTTAAAALTAAVNANMHAFSVGRAPMGVNCAGKESQANLERTKRLISMTLWLQDPVL